MKTILLALLVLAPGAAMAGSCSYVAYNNCYARHVTYQPTRAQIHFDCVFLPGSDVSSGHASDADSLKGCELNAREFGELVEVTYFDSNTGETQKGNAYRGRSIK
jgi:hypothetical protein